MLENSPIGPINPEAWALAVKSKTTGGTGVMAGTWNYSYSPTSTDDTTTVTFPGGQEI